MSLLKATVVSAYLDRAHPRGERVIMGLEFSLEGVDYGVLEVPWDSLGHKSAPIIGAEFWLTATTKEGE